MISDMRATNSFPCKLSDGTNMYKIGNRVFKGANELVHLYSERNLKVLLVMIARFNPIQMPHPTARQI